MKLIVINGTVPSLVPGIDGGTDILLKVVTDTIIELGEEITQIKLDKLLLPFYGSSSKLDIGDITNIIYDIMSANGVIFAVPTILGSPSALVCAFLEYFSMPQFRQGLLDKNCMVITTSVTGGVRNTFDYMSKAIEMLGGFDAIRISAPGDKLKNGIDEEVQYIVEKQTEDFYKILRQGRRFFPYDEPVYYEEEPFDISKQSENLISIQNAGIQKFQELKDLVSKSSFTDEQESDITEIAKIITEKFGKPSSDGETRISPIIRPKNKTCKQLTQSMPHYFNPQFAAGMKTSLLLEVFGDENFKGSLTIDSSSCSFNENTPIDDAEITIIVDSKVWTDILTGKYTAQKAFMIGQLKVRGNFLLLTKFDQLFSKIDN